MANEVFVVQSSVNYSCCDSETCFAVVGVADNKERAEEMLKEEVKNFFVGMNERFCYGEDPEYWDLDHELSVDNTDDFKGGDYYHFNDTDLDVFAEVNILTKTINA